MFSIVIYKKNNFLKNTKCPYTGAMQKMIDQLEPENRIIQIYNKNNPRMWGQCSESQILDLVKRTLDYTK